MTTHDLGMLPVLAVNGTSGNSQLVGLLTRADVLRTSGHD